jgi:hypothetical protein
VKRNCGAKILVNVVVFMKNDLLAALLPARTGLLHKFISGIRIAF